jgi:hypothetical protein
MKMAGYGLPLFLRGIYNAVEESEEGCEFIEESGICGAITNSSVPASKLRTCRYSG